MFESVLCMILEDDIDNDDDDRHGGHGGEDEDEDDDGESYYSTGGGGGGGGGPLELNAITIMPSPINKEKKTNLGRSSQLFDVHDGQQRLVSICLIFAALRDNFLEWGEDWEEDAVEIAKAIYPTKPRLDPVARIQLNEGKDSIMHSILSNEGINDGYASNDDYGNENNDGSFHRNYQTYYTPKKRKLLPKSELYILEAYEYLRERVKDLRPKKAIRFLDALRDQTFLLVCIPSSTRMARSIVMGLGKGKVSNIMQIILQLCVCMLEKLYSLFARNQPHTTDFVWLSSYLANQRI